MDQYFRETDFNRVGRFFSGRKVRPDWSPSLFQGSENWLRRISSSVEKNHSIGKCSRWQILLIVVFLLGCETDQCIGHYWCSKWFHIGFISATFVSGEPSRSVDCCRPMVFASHVGLSGEEVVPVINQVIREVNFDVVAYTYDWHPVNHISFYENRHLRKTAPESSVSSSRALIVTCVRSFGSARHARSLRIKPMFSIQSSSLDRRTRPDAWNRFFGRLIVYRKRPVLIFIVIWSAWSTPFMSTRARIPKSTRTQRFGIIWNWVKQVSTVNWETDLLPMFMSSVWPPMSACVSSRSSAWPTNIFSFSFNGNACRGE